MGSSFAKAILILLIATINWSAEAQIVPDGTTATIVDGNLVIPTVGGTLSGGTLYHNLNQFNVSQTGVVLGVWNSGVNGASINNIIIRVTGNTPSLIAGTIDTRSAFPNANLYLLNPNGLLLAKESRLDLGGSFHASTGTGLGFTGFEPTEIEFAIDRPAAIFNEGILATSPGRHLTLIGGSVFSEGELNAPNATVGVVAVSGGSRVELRSPETALGVNVITGALEPAIESPSLELPQLARILRTNAPQEAKTLVINPDGTVNLVTENQGLQDRLLDNGRTSTTGAFTVLPGDVSVKTIRSGNVQINALSDLVLLLPQIGATGNISLAAGNTTVVRDTLEFASTIRPNGNLLIRGDGLVDILAINHPESAIALGGNLVFVSRNDIFGDANFEVGGRVIVSPAVDEAESASLLNDFAAPRLPFLLQPSPRFRN